ncbi:WYL domain-containing protein [Streptosporangium sp. NPDC000239]|uniref:WYL domain-containing protein n=1 Tax=Streptosporangium sp. NPDC000239 TaxID=3154248 RepID=UPI003333D559
MFPPSPRARVGGISWPATPNGSVPTESRESRTSTSSTSGSTWRTYLECCDARRHRGETTLRLSPNALDRPPHLMEPAVVHAVRRASTPPDPDGWTRVTIPIGSVERALPELLKLGAEVLAPVELRERITQTLDTLIDLHRRPT